MIRAAFLPILVGLSACASTDAAIDPDVSLAFAPIGRVDAEELRAAVEREVAAARVCIRVPRMWWERAGVVRFGPTSWRGLRIDDNAEERLNDLVEMGAWSSEEFYDEEGVRLVRLHPTELGRRSLREDYHGLQFCPPAERRLVRVVEMTLLPAEPSPPILGFDPHSAERVNVTFEWIGVAQPSWLSTPELRSRYAALLPEYEQVSRGSIVLYRVWRRGQHSLVNAPHSGALQPYCYDNIHNMPLECAPTFGLSFRASAER
jgi:hypothetical protein